MDAVICFEKKNILFSKQKPYKITNRLNDIDY